MELNLKERIAILSSLPSTGGFIDLMFIKQIQDLIGITNDDNKKYEIQTIDNGSGKFLGWNSLGDTQYNEYNIDSNMLKVINSSFKKLDEDKSLTIDHLSIVEKVFNKVKELGL